MGMVVNASLGLDVVRSKYSAALALGGPIQQLIDSTVIKGVEPYVPMRAGTLTKSAVLHTRIGYGMIIWKTPYARYLYHGFVMEGSAPRAVTNRPLVFYQGRHPQAGSHWCERYKADHLRELTGMVQRKVANL